MKNQIVESGESKWLVRSAESMDDAMDAIAMARCTGSSGSKTVVNDTACGGTERVKSCTRCGHTVAIKPRKPRKQEQQ